MKNQPKSDNARWAARPKTEDKPFLWRIQRCGTKGMAPQICLSLDVCGCYTHYWSGRTTACVQDDCAGCDVGMVPRWRGYFAAVNPVSGTRVLVEVTPGCSDAIEEYFGIHKTLRGAMITLKRDGTRENGRLSCVLKLAVKEQSTLPVAPDVAEILSKVWRLTHRPKHLGDTRDVAMSRENGRIKRVPVD